MQMYMEFYGLFLTSYNIEVTADELTEVIFKMKSVSPGSRPQLEELSRDISVINSIRENNDPAVQAQWEQLLTTVALTAGRNVPDVIDSMARNSEK